MKELLNEVKDVAVKVIDFIDYCENDMNDNSDKLELNLLILAANLNYLDDYIKQRTSKIIEEKLEECKEAGITYQEILNADIILNTDDKPDNEDGYSLEVGNYEVIIKNIQKISKDEILLSYTFVNNSKNSISLNSAIIIRVYQDGIEICETWNPDNNIMKSVKPGYSIDINNPYTLEGSGDIEIEIECDEMSDSVVLSF